MLKTVILQLSQIQLEPTKTYEGLDGFHNMIADLKRNQINIISINSDIRTVFKTYHISKPECLVICDLEHVVLDCFELGIPCIAYENVNQSKQDLFRANMLVQGFMEVDYTFILEVYQRFHHEPIVIATTKRLLIREMVLDDLDELYDLYADSSVAKFLEPLYEREEEIEFTKAYIKNMYGFFGYGLWSLVDKSSGRLVGRAGLSNREVDGEIQIELGYMIGESYQRQGIAYEACLEILKFAVRRLDCYFVNCFVHPDNVASIKLVEKLEFDYMDEIEIGDEKLFWYRWTYKQ